MKKNILETIEISKYYGNKKVLNKVNLAAKESTSLAIIGESGTGKTTLLNILGGLDKPDKGKVLLFNKDIRSTKLEELRNKLVGFIFQSHNLLERYTVLDNLLLVKKICREPCGPGTDAYRRVFGLLKDVGLEYKYNSCIDSLSGGEKQRVAIARSMVNNPKIILADEPTGSLDSKSSLKIQKLLLHSCKKNNKLLIVVTHDVSFAKMCDLKFCLNLQGNLQVCNK